MTKERTGERIRAFVCDWEGCCTYPGGGRVPWPTVDLLGLVVIINKMYQKWLDNTSNPQLVLCTGRQFPYAEAALQALNAFWDQPWALPSVVENGAGLYIPATKEVIRNPRIKPEVAKQLSEVKEKTDELVDRFKGNKEAGKEYCISVNPPHREEDVKRFKEEAQKKYMIDLRDKELIEIFFEVVKKELRTFVDGNLIQVTHSKSAVDITPSGVDKGGGLVLFTNSTGIQSSELVGIGDSKGDAPLLTSVGYPACPANADEITKEIVKSRNGYISPYECTEGVIDIIKHYLPFLDPLW